MAWTFYSATGQKLTTAATAIDVLDIDGATDIGAAIVDADLFIVDDGAGGTNRKTAASRVATYIEGAFTAGAKVDLGSNLLVGNAGSTGIAISANGEVNMAKQPSVGANAQATSNVTGNNAVHKMQWDEVWDIGGDFAGNDTFTAPVTGKYLVTAHLEYSELGSANIASVNIVASNRAWDTYSDPEGAGQLVLQNIVVIDMDAADTMYVNALVNGTGADTVDVEGSLQRSSLTIWLLG